MATTPTAVLMDGSALSARLIADTALRASQLAESIGRRPCLAAVLVGNDPASVTYVAMKRARCEKANIDSRLVHLDPAASAAHVVDTVHELSADPTVDGILVQHPLPAHVVEQNVFEAIDPAKDVDGVTMRSFAAMAFDLPGHRSCTPAGILRLLDFYRVELTGRHAVVIGRSPILGKPVGLLLLARDATVTYCHSKTRDLPAIVAGADIVVAAVGKPRLVQGDWITPGSVVVDAGYNPGNVGDVAYDEASLRASHITPVPGGVGPMTVAVLLEQTVDAAAATHRRHQGAPTR
jgi:methylenetetrahydrofolate dehydrogenase (NADP+)/methenyltetrahydrofolate cyclohydrolase